MKRLFGVLTIFSLLVLVFTSCQKQDDSLAEELNSQNVTNDEISLKSLEPEVIVKGTGEKEDYEKVVVEEIVRSKKCKGEAVSGIVEFYYENTLVFSVDFGDGLCDGVATVSWLDDNNVLQSKVVDVWRLFRNNGHQHGGKKCFKLVFPVTYTMPDGTTQITLESKEDRELIKNWYEENPGYEGEKPVLNYPVDIKYRDGNIVTINNEEEMREAKKDCEGGHGKPCFKLLFPQTWTMPDGTTQITLESKEDRELIKNWYEENPGYEGEKPVLNYPVDIKYRDGSIVTINSEEEMIAAKEDCEEGRI